MVDRELNFGRDLEQLINRYSVENDSNTPDFILAGYIVQALNNFASAVREREQWHGARIGIAALNRTWLVTCDSNHKLSFMVSGPMEPTSCPACGGKAITQLKTDASPPTPAKSGATLPRASAPSGEASTNSETV